MKKHSTLKDVASRARVSIATVSRVINSNIPKSASKEVQDRIWSAVKELNYIPNTTAQNLKTGKNKNKPHKVIACVFSRCTISQADPFFLEISQALESEMLKYGYLVKYSISSIEMSEDEFLTVLNQDSIEGIVVLGRIDEKSMRTIKSLHKYVVYVGLNRLNFDIDQVICDGYDAAMMALEYLNSTGEHVIHYLGECQNEVRYTAFYHFMSRTVPQNEISDLIIETDFNSEQAYSKVMKIIREGIIPKALFCGNDMAAIGALKALRENNIKVPEDTAVIGIDNIEMSQFSIPMLTTIEIPKEHLGRKAARFLIDRIINGNDINVTMQIPMKLIKRESTK
ncbi:LacI family DNA-binding transcriptional regulator [Tuanshanicoccus lijuaniae]|uniref:LacI family DNA-binding transcriptional regulator n=1 Tax=Aerococcaceae bacterium zg-1292 TaxID=2774330 RepID=UPI001936F87E|nr:LacI family DNA-binding transcriptional regulator [Aerococcaceae bacterium zg-1292]MBF6978208.1 LacI family DNA-binding transcriptional regulator [Aerococcaceae bacterium zg-BR22]MBS4456426.1 LacI family DNA-binding transcriptional regulator [Aerococcaceae bacterium zg-A91]MBS4458276.1 LacI family DNA-binding transcriptional regulator [Aerococcaceae bacterium zg-BR33]QQA37492.1 LacI family DNA-binding transcriptional regulator [Aerococcaceae bacterium zg-1292]